MPLQGEKLATGRRATQSNMSKLRLCNSLCPRQTLSRLLELPNVISLRRYTAMFVVSSIEMQVRRRSDLGSCDGARLEALGSGWAFELATKSRLQ